MRSNRTLFGQRFGVHDAQGPVNILVGIPEALKVDVASRAPSGE